MISSISSNLLEQLADNRRDLGPFVSIRQALPQRDRRTNDARKHIRVEVGYFDLQVGEPLLRLSRRSRSDERPSYYDRIVDVMEELVRFTVLSRPHAERLVDRYSERKAVAARTCGADDHPAVAMRD